MTTIVHKRGTGIPAADDLAVGEIAIDTSTGTAYTKNNAGEVVPVGGDSGGGEIDDSNYVKLDDDNQIGSEFYLHNADWTFNISDGEIFSQYVVGQHIAVGGEGYRSIKSDLNRVGYDAFAVINSDGSQSMSITQAGVVQAQDFLDADGNSIIGGDVEFDNTHVIGEATNRNTGVGLDTLGRVSTGQYNTATGYWAMRNVTTASYNTATGYYALGSTNGGGGYNTAFGSHALYMTTGTSNTAVGTFTGRALTSGNFNTAVGSNALRYDTTGTENTAIGAQALNKTNGGSYNTAVGGGAIEFNVTGRDNTAVGANALKENIAGHDNTAIGHTALYKNTVGNNTAVGAGSQFNTTTGSKNTSVGQGSMLDNREGEKNTVIGYQAGLSIRGNTNTAIGAETGPDYRTPDIENTTCIGYQASANESNMIQLGNGYITLVKTHGSMQAKEYLDRYGNPATVSPSSIVEAFTTLQTAVADEDTVEGIKTALTNALGGLIEKFEGMSK